MIIKRIILFALTGMLLAGTCSFRTLQAQQQEYILKAAFVYRFVDYVEWGENDNETLNIAVVGESDILLPLIGISRGKTAKNKRIIVRQYSNANNIGSCQIIFISRKHKQPIEMILSRVETRPVLVITEREEDFDKGAQINFLISENKLKFEVNLNAVSKSGLKISSQLLQHAYMIRR